MSDSTTVKAIVDLFIAPRESGRLISVWTEGNQQRPDGQVTYRQPRGGRFSEARPSRELIAVWSERGS